MSIPVYDDKLCLSHYLLKTRAEGPGLRAGIWVQGCPNHCPGCAAPETWPFDIGDFTEVQSLAEKILSVPELSGITIAGGEPFAQAGALAILANKMQENGLSVITFTGYTLESLHGRDADTDALLAATDLLIDGPYIEAQASDERPLVGSSNQRLIFLTERLKAEWETWAQEPRKVEIHIFPNGQVVANGIKAVEAICRIKNSSRDRS